MEIFHYDFAGLVRTREGNLPLYNLDRQYKTRTVKNHNGFSMVIKSEDIVIAPETYWSISSRYCQMNEGHDANCYLCGWYGMDYGTCKCKKSGFTVDEHINHNVFKARRKYLITIIDNYFPEIKKSIAELSDWDIGQILYDNDPVYGYRVMMELPSWSERDQVIKRMSERLIKFQLI
jgi:hypothetical protein